MNSDIVPLKIAKISANDGWPLIYIPKEALDKLNLQSGSRVLIALDEKNRKMIVRPLEMGQTP